MGKGMKNRRSIVFAAYPRLSGQLRTIFSSAEGSIRKRLENPPAVRQGGWDLWTPAPANIIRGEMIRVESKDQKRIDLYRDGTLILAILDHYFLDLNELRINLTAIVEVVYNFINFYVLVLEDFREKPEEISFRVDFRNMHLKGETTYLPLLPSFPSNQVHQGHAPKNNGTILLDNLRTEGFHVGAVAFEVLKELYRWFGVEETEIEIPYTKIEDELKMIDPDGISKIQ